jgi:hypothetical protein
MTTDAPAPLTADEAATVIARWWAQWLRRPATHDNGDRSPTGGFGVVLAGRLAADTIAKLPPEAADRFEAALRLRVRDAHVFGVGDDRLPSVDYHPNDILCRAASAADIGDADWVLPVKSSTRVDCVEGGYVVRIRHGYGAPWTILPALEVSR